MDKDNVPCLVYERGGRTLADAVSSGRIPEEMRRRVCAQLARAVKSLHKAGVMHLDLKGDSAVKQSRNVRSVQRQTLRRQRFSERQVF